MNRPSLAVLARLTPRPLRAPPRPPRATPTTTPFSRRPPWQSAALARSSLFTTPAVQGLRALATLSPDPQRARSPTSSPTTTHAPRFQTTDDIVAYLQSALVDDRGTPADKLARAAAAFPDPPADNDVGSVNHNDDDAWDPSPPPPDDHHHHHQQQQLDPQLLRNTPRIARLLILRVLSYCARHVVPTCAVFEPLIHAAVLDHDWTLASDMVNELASSANPDLHPVRATWDCVLPPLARNAPSLAMNLIEQHLVNDEKGLTDQLSPGSVDAIIVASRSAHSRAVLDRLRNAMDRDPTLRWIMPHLAEGYARANDPDLAHALLDVAEHEPVDKTAILCARVVTLFCQRRVDDALALLQQHEQPPPAMLDCAVKYLLRLPAHRDTAVKHWLAVTRRPSHVPSLDTFTDLVTHAARHAKWASSNQSTADATNSPLATFDCFQNWRRLHRTGQLPMDAKLAVPLLQWATYAAPSELGTILHVLRTHRVRIPPNSAQAAMHAVRHVAEPGDCGIPRPALYESLHAILEPSAASDALILAALARLGEADGVLRVLRRVPNTTSLDARAVQAIAQHLPADRAYPILREAWHRSRRRHARGADSRVIAHLQALLRLTAEVRSRDAPYWFKQLYGPTACRAGSPALAAARAEDISALAHALGQFGEVEVVDQMVAALAAGGEVPRTVAAAAAHVYSRSLWPDQAWLAMQAVKGTDRTAKLAWTSFLAALVKVGRADEAQALMLQLVTGPSAVAADLDPDAPPRVRLGSLVPVALPEPTPPTPAAALTHVAARGELDPVLTNVLLDTYRQTHDAPRLHRVAAAHGVTAFLDWTVAAAARAATQMANSSGTTRTCSLELLAVGLHRWRAVAHLLHQLAAPKAGAARPSGMTLALVRSWTAARLVQVGVPAATNGAQMREKELAEVAHDAVEKVGENAEEVQEIAQVLDAAHKARMTVERDLWTRCRLRGRAPATKLAEVVLDGKTAARRAR
ncbi:hypothetical protein AMAG_01963 [Allomyces macrogynus ATCC 38327]|uniref:Uncharacterized protein n=1 Tax=Allomyces macrogynus (strain ATCC 38327) TaxID=578462 RepID=A0A0L0S164_ALLM3|nr:hypothetical protein AMAG_01963 [Allomyces macrogynus ATCC 38327]|eukprot:KNE56126.1 hypothetical protein AMAG_01963 [Allomyces macrogynus ATCC 38327]